LILMNWVVKGFLVLGRILESFTGVATKSSVAVKLLASTLIGLMIASQVTGVLMAIIKVIRTLGTTTALVTGALGLFVGMLAAIVLMVPRVRNWITNLGNQMLSLFGIQIPQSINYTNAALASLGGGGVGDIDWQQLIDSFSDVEDEATKAGKAVKDTFLAAFDEVYTIPEKTEAAGIGDILGDFDMGDFDFGVPQPDLFGGSERVKQEKSLIEKLWDL